MTKSILNIAAVQMAVRVGEPQVNLDRTSILLQEAVQAGAGLVCFPESVLDGYACRQPELPHLARPVPCFETDEIAEQAQKHHVWVLWSLAERHDDSVFNSALLFDPQGEIKLHYRKTHLCGEVGEINVYQHGSSLQVAEIDGWTVGVMICYDRHYPEVARSLALQGAQLILHPTATVWFKPDPLSINTAMMRTRAYENRCFILSINQVNYGGGSAFFSPWGETLAISGDEETILMAEADPSQLVMQPENHFDILAGRQPHLYRNDKP
jgi:predicted amidohydrolase